MNSFRIALIGCILALAGGCTTDSAPSATIGTSSTAAAASTVAADRPAVIAVDIPGDADTYSVVEMTVELDAEYDNPFDQREVSLDATFTGPGGETLNLPGFWEGKECGSTNSRSSAREGPVRSHSPTSTPTSPSV